MAYKCQNFKDGQVLTAECLNKMEKGIEEACAGVKTINGTPPDENGNVEVAGSGKDGITPHIGANGNWWIGETDTGVKASGATVEDVLAALPTWTGGSY